MTQKQLLSTAKPATSVEQEEWLANQKKRLVAANKEERQKQVEEYKKDKANFKLAGTTPSNAPGGAPDSDLEAKRQALRDKLAQKFKSDLMKNTFSGQPLAF